MLKIPSKLQNNQKNKVKGIGSGYLLSLSNTRGTQEFKGVFIPTYQLIDKNSKNRFELVKSTLVLLLINKLITVDT